MSTGAFVAIIVIVATACVVSVLLARYKRAQAAALRPRPVERQPTEQEIQQLTKRAINRSEAEFSEGAGGVCLDYPYNSVHLIEPLSRYWGPAYKVEQTTSERTGKTYVEILPHPSVDQKLIGAPTGACDVIRMGIIVIDRGVEPQWMIDARESGRWEFRYEDWPSRDGRRCRVSWKPVDPT
jgi:hypothetical protein